MLKLATLVAAMLLATLPNDALHLSAKLVADKLEVGQKYYITLDVALGGRALASKAGMPAPVLQIELPSSVELTGKVLTTYKELAGNEFLHAPFERLAKVGSNKIRFTLVKAPAPTDRVFLNVLAYVSPDRKSDDSYFVRRRLSLALAPGAVAEEVSAEQSTWHHEGALQIGDEAALFELPKANGVKVALKDYIGKKNIIVTTYRAFW